MKTDSSIPGLLLLLALTLAILGLVLFTTGCAEYPVAIVVRGELGSVSYSKQGIEINIEK